MVVCWIALGAVVVIDPNDGCEGRSSTSLHPPVGVLRMFNVKTRCGPQTPRTGVSPVVAGQRAAIGWTESKEDTLPRQLLETGNGAWFPDSNT